MVLDTLGAFGIEQGALRDAVRRRRPPGRRADRVSRDPLITPAAPPEAVLRAFGVRGRAGPARGWPGPDLPGRRRRAQARRRPAGAARLAVRDLRRRGPRTTSYACPSRSAREGGWSAHGWAAHRWLEGGTARAGDDPDRFRRTADAFHEVVAGLDRPAFLDHREDAWSFGDRVAFEGVAALGRPETLALLEPLLAALRPVETAAQVIHGDLGGNLLRAPGLADAVIDWPPYFRPRGFALAVTASDAVTWEGAPRLAARPVGRRAGVGPAAAACRGLPGRHPRARRGRGSGGRRDGGVRRGVPPRRRPRAAPHRMRAGTGAGGTMGG